MPSKINNKCELLISLCSSLGFGIWCGYYIGIYGVIAGLIFGLFLPISISIIIDKICIFIINIKKYRVTYIKKLFVRLFGYLKTPWGIWWFLAMVFGVAVSIFYFYSFGIFGLLLGAAGGFFSFYIVTLIILKVIRVLKLHS
jgi:hypothetical protein